MRLSVKSRTKLRLTVCLLFAVVFFGVSLWAGVEKSSFPKIIPYYHWLAKNWSVDFGETPTWQLDRMIEAVSPSNPIQMNSTEVAVLEKDLRVLLADPNFNDVSWFLVVATISHPSLDEFAINELENILSRSLPDPLPGITSGSTSNSSVSTNSSLKVEQERFLSFFDKLSYRLMEIPFNPGIKRTMTLTGKLLARVHLNSEEILTEVVKNYLNRLSQGQGPAIATFFEAYFAARGIAGGIVQRTLTLRVKEFSANLDAVFSNPDRWFDLPFGVAELVRQPEIQAKLALNLDAWINQCWAWNSGLHVVVYGSGHPLLKSKVEEIFTRRIQNRVEEPSGTKTICQSGPGHYSHRRMSLWDRENFFNVEALQDFQREIVYPRNPVTQEDYERQVFQQLVWSAYGRPARDQLVCELALSLPFHDRLQPLIDSIYLGMDNDEPERKFVECYIKKKWGARYQDLLELRRKAGIRRELVQSSNRNPRGLPSWKHYSPELKGDSEVIESLRKIITNANLSFYPRTRFLVLALLIPSLRGTALPLFQEIMLNQPNQLSNASYFFSWPADEVVAREFFKKLLVDLNFNKQQLFSIAQRSEWMSSVGANNMASVMIQEFMRYASNKYGDLFMNQLKQVSQSRNIENQVGISSLRNIIDSCQQNRNNGASAYLEFPVGLAKNSFLPQIRELILEILQSQNFKMCPKKGFKGGVLYLALASDDPRLEKVIGVQLQERLRSSGSANELRVVLDELWEYLSLNLLSSKESIENLATKFARIIYDYNLVASELETGALSSANSIYSKFAQKWIQTKKGDEYLKQVLNRRSSFHKEFIYINGGYSPASNNQANEVDLMTFHLGLFNETTHILNAGGPNGTVVAPGGGIGQLNYEGDLMKLPKTEMRTLKLLPGLSLNQPFESATRKNIEGTYRSIPASTTELTVIYGGHGDPSGFASWGGDRISARDVLNFEKLLPKKTLVRSIFTQCYAGATVVLPGRVVPSFEAGFRQFTEHHYPSGRCGLAGSSEEELNRYLNWSNDWKNGAWTSSPWARMMKSRTVVSLQSVKDFLFSAGESVSTPIMTSDYFVRDLSETLCGERDLRTEFIKKFGEDPNRWNSEAKLTWSQFSVSPRNAQFYQQLNEICDSTLLKEIKTIRKNLAEFYLTIYLPIERFSRQAAFLMMAQYYPRVYAENKAILEKLQQMGDATYRKINQRGILAENKAFFDEIRILGNLTDEYQILVASLLLDPRFTSDFNRYGVDYFGKNFERFKDYLPESFKFIGPSIDLKMPTDGSVVSNPAQDGPNLVFMVRDGVFGKGTALQSERKLKEQVAQGFLREKVENLLRDPSLQFFAQRYHEIRYCESSAIGY